MIRSYQPTDLDDLLAAWTAATAVAHPFLPAIFLAQERQNIAHIYLPQAQTWVWEAEERVVGFLSPSAQEMYPYV